MTLSNLARVAVLAARSAVWDGRDVGPNTVAVLLAELERPNRAHDALEWYADPDNYSYAEVKEIEPGAKARAALAGRACRICGCTDDEACVREPGAEVDEDLTCQWTEPDLCSACTPNGPLPGWIHPARPIVLDLTYAQRDALKGIVEEWVGEGFETPEYTDAQYDIFEALGVESPIYDTKRPS